VEGCKGSVDGLDADSRAGDRCRLVGARAVVVCDLLVGRLSAIDGVCPVASVTLSLIGLLAPLRMGVSLVPVRGMLGLRTTRKCRFTSTKTSVCRPVSNFARDASLGLASSTISSPMILAAVLEQVRNNE
jgi:hypothetical protein